MNWLHKRFQSLSEGGVYEISGRYTNQGFAWRGRVIATDELVASSHDRQFVEGRCESHAARVAAEASV